MLRWAVGTSPAGLAPGTMALWRDTRLQRGTAPWGRCLYVQQRSVCSGLGMRGLTADMVLPCAWVGILGDSASRLHKPPGCRVGTRVWCWSSETAKPFWSPGHRRVCWSRPWERAASCPRLRVSPPCHRLVPASPPTALSPPHPGSTQAACMASPRHCPTPWLLWLLLWAPWGTLCLVKRGGMTGAGSSGGWRGPVPGALVGSGLCPLTGGFLPCCHPLGVAEGPCSRPVTSPGAEPEPPVPGSGGGPVPPACPAEPQRARAVSPAAAPPAPHGFSLPPCPTDPQGEDGLWGSSF